MILHYRQYPPGKAGAPALVILHGLYGNLGNWASQAKVLARDWAVCAMDLRNHGQSPHADSMPLDAMADDVVATLDALGLERVHLLGHSMGGKVAMRLAQRYPARVASLIIVDIAPVAYPTGDTRVLGALTDLDLEAISSRTGADRDLARTIESQVVRQFLLANLLRDDDGHFRWRFNLDVIARDFGALIGWPGAQDRFDGAVLFVRGANSDYLLDSHREAVLAQFPNATLKTVAGAGHWVHSEKPETFLRLVGRFLAQSGTGPDGD